MEEAEKKEGGAMLLPPAALRLGLGGEGGACDADNCLATRTAASGEDVSGTNEDFF